MCFDQILHNCRLCGHKIPMGTTWHGKRVEYYDWLEKYGNICVYCEADIKQEARKQLRAQAPKAGRRRR